MMTSEEQTLLDKDMPPIFVLKRSPDGGTYLQRKQTKETN